VVLEGEFFGMRGNPTTTWGHGVTSVSEKGGSRRLKGGQRETTNGGWGVVGLGGKKEKAPGEPISRPKPRKGRIQRGRGAVKSWSIAKRTRGKEKHGT